MPASLSGSSRESNRIAEAAEATRTSGDNNRVRLLICISSALEFLFLGYANRSLSAIFRASKSAKLIDYSSQLESQGSVWVCVRRASGFTRLPLTRTARAASFPVLATALTVHVRIFCFKFLFLFSGNSCCFCLFFNH